MAKFLILKTVEGGERWREFVFGDEERVVLGRSQDCTLRLFGDDTVSRWHCLVRVEGEGASVQDLNSLNGTFVNGQLVGQRPRDAKRGIQPRHPLQDGDELSVGSHTFHVELVAADPVEAGGRELCGASA